VYLKRNIVLFLTILILIDDLDEEYEPEGQNEIKNEGPSQNTKAPEKISNQVIFLIFNLNSCSSKSGY
jgi:hypothetical protein